MGLLRVRGSIDLAQFWPIGSSDADTTKMHLEVNDGSFEYRPEGAGSFTVTRVFGDAVSRGQGTKPVIAVSSKTGLRTITVRLQGVDAPELHYKASALRRNAGISDPVRKAFNTLNTERRQAYAESSTVAMARHLKTYADSRGRVRADFVTRVDYPYEAVDTYGRFIGNIILREGHDLNQWLVRNGWAFPTFYTSMAPEEIRQYLKAWERGNKQKNRTAGHLTSDAGVFDWELGYRKPPVRGRFRSGQDSGEVLMPKLFRRQVAWRVSAKTGVLASGSGFATYLKRQPDQLVLLRDFLDNGVHSADVRRLDEFVDAQNRVLRRPEELVFKEKPGTVVNARGRKITAW